MIIMTATETARNFSEVLDQVERGETVVITRKGKNIVTMTRAHVSNGKAILALLGKGLPDADYAKDVRAAREAVHPDPCAWTDDE